ncbi:MAG: PBSX family phage terminase large subunit [Hyphomonadaceae bacterium]|nr:PBSX family phage terminase large subunit [Clostridia bacterium]
MEFDCRNVIHYVNHVYLPFFQSHKRFAVLYGGAGSGKSYAVAQKIIVRMMAEDGHNILCVRKTGASVVKSQYPLLLGVIRDFGLKEHFEIHKSQGREKITFRPKGNQIIFSGLDDVEKLKSIYNITSIWIEEASEIAVSDFRELNRRMRGYAGKNEDGSTKYMQIMLSFNPISHLCWLKEYFFDRRPKNALVLHTTYQDNRFIDQHFCNEMEALKQQNAYEYQVYALGRWGVTGGSYFDAQAVSDRIAALEKSKPIKQGLFTFEYKNEKITDASMTFSQEADGCICLYALPKAGNPYVLGGDTAGLGSDAFTAQILDNVSGEQVAVLRGQMDEDLYARQIYCLAKYYNGALVGLETNFSTHPVRELCRLGYDEQVLREVPDTFTGKLKEAYGFVTNRVTRPVILAQLRAVVRDFPTLIHDIPTLEEMLTFVRNEKGRPEAQSGKHDDLIMALAIAWHIRSQGEMTVKTNQPQKTKKLLKSLKQ